MNSIADKQNLADFQNQYWHEKNMPNVQTQIKRFLNKKDKNDNTDFPIFSLIGFYSQDGKIQNVCIHKKCGNNFELITHQTTNKKDNSHEKIIMQHKNPLYIDAVFRELVAIHEWDYEGNDNDLI